MRSGRFREDLLFRLNVVEITRPAAARAARGHPPARPPLPRLPGAPSRAGRRPSSPRAAEEVLRRYAWPGNLRELRNTLERAVILWPAAIIEPAAFPERMQLAPATGPQLGGDFSLEEIEREHILRVLARQKTLDAAAAILGIDASTLWRKRKKYDG